MSGESAKRRKTSPISSAGAPALDSLPPELLETICGFLDVRTLCTARLLCTQFRDAASRCIHSVELCVDNLRSRPETTLSNFPNLSRVSVHDVKEDDLAMLAQSPLADAVTHVRAAECLRLMPRRGRSAACSPLLPLPNLVSLTVNCSASRAFPFPQTLRELIFERPVPHRTANLVAVLTNLTCLRIDVHRIRKPFEAVTALTALRKLEISCSPSLVPIVAELTLLTHLNIIEVWMPAVPIGFALASLTRLHRLVHLGVGAVGMLASLEFQLLACIGTLTALRSLDLRLCSRPERSAFETVCMTPFSQLTALKLKSFRLDASFLPRFNLEGLQDLTISSGVELEREGVVALRRATGLTQLELWKVGTSVGLTELGTALLHMSRLRALSLTTTAASQTRFCSEAIGRLTDLTRLRMCGRGVNNNAVVAVCIGLKKLRVLSLTDLYSSQPAPSDSLTPETFFAVAQLPELGRFNITGMPGTWPGDLTDGARASLNAERHDKGRPPLELDVHY